MNENESFIEDLKNEVDSAHTVIDGANAPPPNLWRTVRAQSQPTTINEEKRMIAPISPSPVPMSTTRPIVEERKGVRHSLNLAASFLVVLSVALGGWFANMQLNQPGNPDLRFAALGLQPEDAGNGVCDVESLTVDETIAIMQDPLGSLLEEGADPVSMGLPESWFDPPLFRGVSSNIEAALESPWFYDMPPSETDYEEIATVANEFLDCHDNPDTTVGQIWRFLDPLSVRQTLFWMMPGFVSEEEARELLPDMLGALQLGDITTPVSDELEYPRRLVNPEREYASYVAFRPSVHMSSVVVAPIIHFDGEGNIRVNRDLFGEQIGENPDFWQHSSNIMMGKSAVDRNWYVIGIFFPPPPQD